MKQSQRACWTWPEKIQKMESLDGDGWRRSSPSIAKADSIDLFIRPILHHHHHPGDRQLRRWPLPTLEESPWLKAMRPEIGSMPAQNFLSIRYEDPRKGKIEDSCDCWSHRYRLRQILPGEPSGHSLLILISPNPSLRLSNLVDNVPTWSTKETMKEAWIWQVSTKVTARQEVGK